MLRPPRQCGPLLIEVGVGVVPRPDPLLRVTEHALSDVRLDLEPGQAGTTRAPQIMKRECLDSGSLKSVQVSRNLTRQEDQPSEWSANC
jgi:hypothetical protein